MVLLLTINNSLRRPLITILIAENIKTKDRNAYIQNKNTPYNTKIDTSSQYAKEVKKLRYTKFQSKPTTTMEIENIIKTLKPKKDMMKFQLNY